MVGARIAARRKELNMSQDELAKRMGYKSRSTINKIELGINDITQSKIAKFATVLDTTPADLMGWETDHENKENPTADEGDGVSKAKQELIGVIQNCPEDKVARLSAIIQLFLDGEH